MFISWCSIMVTKAIAALGAFVAVFAVAGAYDFSDTYFNQYLNGELQDFYYSPEITTLHVRNRRDNEAARDDERCHHRHGPPMCCGRDLHHSLMDHDTKKQCFQEVVGTKDEPRGPPPDPFNCDKANHHRRNMACVFQCVGQKQNVIDDNGQIKEKELKDSVKTSFSEYTWIKPKEDEIIDKCIAETKTKMEDWKKKSTEKDDCSPTLMIFSHCVFREIQMNCPDEEIKDKKMCSRLREDITKNGDFPDHPKMPRDEE